MTALAPAWNQLTFCLFCRINLDTVKEHLKTFAVLDSDKDGHISLNDFALHYKLPTSALVKELFSIFDRVRFNYGRVNGHYGFDRF